MFRKILSLFKSIGTSLDVRRFDGTNPSFAIDNDGNPWIAYFSGQRLLVVPPTMRADESPLTIDEGFVTLSGCRPSLAIHDGILHIAYCAMSRVLDGVKASALCYARWNGSKLSRSIVDRSQPLECGVYPSLGISGTGKISISYSYGNCDLNENNLKVALSKGTRWELESPFGIAARGNESSLAYDSKETLHIAFNRKKSDGGELIYAVNTGARFSETRIDYRDDVQGCPSIAVGPDDRPHIAWVFRNSKRNGRLGYASLIDGKWKKTDLGSAEPIYVGGPSLMVEPNGCPVIVYNDRSRLKVAAVSDRDHDKSIAVLGDFTDPLTPTLPSCVPWCPTVNRNSNDEVFVSFMKDYGGSRSSIFLKSKSLEKLIKDAGASQL